MKPIVVTLILILLTGCSRSFHVGRIKPGKSSIEDAIKRLNEPLVVKKSTFDPETEIFAWEDLTIQAKNDTVTAVHRKPASHEKYLQFWQQHYKDEQTIFGPINAGGLKESLWQFNIPHRGINVIYNENNDEVVRVIYYETH